MKKGLILLVLASIAIACVKPQKPKDYREKWVGDWDFVVERTWNRGWDRGHDTVYYSGTISLGSTDSTLNVKYLSVITSTDIPVDKFGKIDNKAYYCNPCINGQFEGNDKVHIRYGYNTGATSSTSIIDGIKKKGDKT